MMVVIPLLSIGQVTTPTGRQTMKTTGGKRYWEYLPPGYAANPTKKYTVVIFLHGNGEKGDYTATNIQQEMMKVLLANTPPAQAESYDFPFILLSPQLQSTQNGWYQGFVDAMINVARDTTKYRVDLNNVYLVGLSLGGGGTWEKGLSTVNNNAAKLRGLVPVCGSGNILANACLAVTNNNRIWAFHGLLDNTVNISVTENMINAINNCNPAPATPPKFTIYEDQGHSIWDEAFRTDNSLHLPNVYQWIMETNPGTPLANAGADVVISLPTTTVTLNGGGTDADGTISAYQWTKVSGGSVTMSGATSASLQLSNLQQGEYVFRLQVTDNSGWPSTPDEIKVTVNAQPNALPVVTLGPDKVIKQASSTYTPSLTGNATDADGTIASYLWTKISGGQVTLVNADTRTVALQDIIPGQYVFRLTATDNLGGTGYDEINVRVNAKPIPNAGPDVTITLPTNAVQITGTATDTDGTVVGYLWEQYSGPTATMSDTDTETLSLTNLVQGNYTFRFTAFDNDGSSDRDYVSVSVKAAPGARMANPDAVASQENADCADCAIVIYDSQGAVLYNGQNSFDAYSPIVNRSRLYYYSLQRNGKKVSSGKVLIQN